jgi:hypothetical protein
MRTFIWPCMLLCIAGFAAAAADDSGKKQKEPPPKQAPQPLFGGSIPVRSSQSTKESATLGFNGIDPSGKVNQRMLAANPQPGDVAQVQNLEQLRPTRAQLSAFAKEGGLKR